MSSIDSLIGFEGRVQKKISMIVVLTANDWQLFTATQDCTAAADALNAAATEALSFGDPEVATGIFEAAQRDWKEFGAWDSEPSRVFDRLFIEVYGRDAYNRYR